MMETSILNQLPFDPGFLILGLIGLSAYTADLVNINNDAAKKPEP